MTPPMRWLFLAPVAGIVWDAGMRAVFRPLQRWLADPALQSAKFLAVFFDLEPAPRMAQASWVLPMGLVVAGAGFAAAYILQRPSKARGPLRSGVRMGALAWLLMVPWFEFYLPWNVMHEPMRLVLLESAAWLIVLVAVGIAVAGTDHVLQRPSADGNMTIGTTSLNGSEAR